MGIRSKDGFTIIETSLFLAVTSLLIIMIIGGTGVSINIQRYRDSVENFKSLVQQQYSGLSSVQNGRDNNWSCDSDSTPVSDSPSAQNRGQSECLLVGKYMRIDDGDVSIYPVLAYPVSTSQTNDIDAMRSNFAMNVSLSEVEERQLEWGTSIAWAKAGDLDVNANTTPRTLGILFIRSPHSGQVYTFTSNNIPAKDSISQATFTELIQDSGDSVDGQGQAARMICVESDGLFIDGNMGVHLAPFASSVNSVEVRTNDHQVSKARGIEC